MLDETLLMHLVHQVRAEEPGTLAIVLHGSYARGAAGPHSDVDLEVMLSGTPRAHYQTLLVERTDGRLLHTSISFQPWTEWQHNQHAPASWSFSLPVRQPIRILWANPAIDQQEIEATYTQPAGGAEAEDFLEYASKVKNAYLVGDELCLRLAAQKLVSVCPSLLGPLNELPPVSNRCEALRTILGFPIAPAHYREDMLVCFGFSGGATESKDVYQSALRLAKGVMELLQASPAGRAIDPTPHIERYLTDGSLQRYLEQ